MEEEVCLQGLLIPKDWHSNGRVKTVALATDDEKEIFIRNPLQRRIMDHLRQRVELWGTFEGSKRRTVFQVSRINTPPPWSD